MLIQTTYASVDAYAKLADKREYSQLFKLILPKAKKGDEKAIKALGYLVISGNYSNLNSESEQRVFLETIFSLAKKGNHNALHYMGDLYNYPNLSKTEAIRAKMDLPLKEDYKSAEKYYYLAFDNGNGYCDSADELSSMLLKVNDRIEVLKQQVKCYLKDEDKYDAARAYQNLYFTYRDDVGHIILGSHYLEEGVKLDSNYARIYTLYGKAHCRGESSITPRDYSKCAKYLKVALEKGEYEDVVTPFWNMYKLGNYSK